MFLTSSVSVPLIRSGKVCALATTGSTHLATLPNAPKTVLQCQLVAAGANLTGLPIPV